MNKKTFLTFQAKYYDALCIVLNLPINESFSIEELGCRRAVIQSMYRDISKYNLGKGLAFFGTIASWFIQITLAESWDSNASDCTWENLKKVLAKDEKWTRLYLRFFTINPILALSGFNFKDTAEEKLIVSELALMWYEMHKSCAKK
ncbi:MAG: hypothetical protein NTY33_01135 [Candidatus Moranbacteria bacterium]|nr:hypothetical protein [Candidatus Moranbacteria bacterium]